MRGLIGRKIGMTQVFDDVGHLIPVTVLEAGPCRVTQVKSTEKEGYEAVQLGFSDKKKSRTSRQMIGHFSKAGLSPQLWLQEFEKVEGYKYKLGQEFKVSIFKEGEFVDVSGTSKGRGFAGVISVIIFKDSQKLTDRLSIFVIPVQLVRRLIRPVYLRG